MEMKGCWKSKGGGGVPNSPRPESKTQPNLSWLLLASNLRSFPIVSFCGHCALTLHLICATILGKVPLKALTWTTLLRSSYCALMYFQVGPIEAICGEMEC